MKAYFLVVLEHLTMLTILSVYVGAGFILQYVLDQGSLIHLGWFFDIYRQLNNFILTYTVIFYSVQVIIRLHPKEGFPGLKRIMKEIGKRYWTPQAVGGFLVVYLSIPVFLSMYSGLKQTIPVVYPFSWDKTFMQMDYFLHMGHHPWRLLQIFTGYPIITKILDSVYTSWHPFLFAGILWQAWSSRRELRSRFFISLLLLFIICGTILAILFSSAGPCYYQHTVAGSDNPYQPQILYLASVHEADFLYSAEGHKLLWRFYTEGIKMPYIGISAMPSIHVGVAILYAILGWKTSRIAGIGFTIYALLILVGSVHLGWHYAIDGYVSAVLTGLIWKGSKWLVWIPDDDGERV